MGAPGRARTPLPAGMVDEESDPYFIIRGAAGRQRGRSAKAAAC